MDVQGLHFADQLSAAVRETFLERGMNVEVSIAVQEGDGFGFDMTPIGCEITEEIMDSVMEAAIKKIEGTSND